MVDDDDAVGPHRGGQPVGDKDRRAALEKAVERRLDLDLGLEVEVGGRLVEHEHARAREEGPCQRHQLPFARRERLAALVNGGVDAMRQPVHELCQADRVDRLADLLA